jgi:cytochrome P450
VARKSVHERFIAKEVDHQDMMSSFIAHGLDETDLVAESLLQILAGADTSATAIRATLLHVITHPTVYSKLRSEIDSAAAKGLISSPVIRDSEAHELPYLQAVIKEGLRIWPPVTGLLSKEAPAEGDSCEIDGKKMFIPGGTKIGLCIWGVVRNEEIFGADSEMFRPERWLIDDADKLARMQKTVDLVFGYGKYQCLGRPVALMELNKIYVELLRNFDIGLVNTTRPWNSGNVGLWIQKELWVRVTERADKVALKA